MAACKSSSIVTTGLRRGALQRGPNSRHRNPRQSCEGATKDEIAASYPSLHIDHINAALAYAAELAREEHLVPIRAM